MKDFSEIKNAVLSSIGKAADAGKDIANKAADKAKSGARIAKLSMEIAGEKENMKKAYIEIGKLYYAEQGATPDGAYAAACEKITASKALIETNNERIAELKQPGDPEPEVEEVASLAETETLEVSKAAPAEEEPDEKQD